MKKSLRATCAMAIGLSLLAPTSAMAYDYTQVFANTTSGSGKVNLYDPHRRATVFTVTSKYNQPRIVSGGTNPHRGTDLGSPFGEPVYAVWNGWVTYASISTYEVDIALDINGDGLRNDNAYVRYDHLSAINVSTGQAVTTSTKIGATGNEGGAFAAHLHFGVMRDSGDGGRPDYWIRNEPYYRNVANWDYGKLLDFISAPAWNNNIASIVVYGKDETGADDIGFIDVVFYHRRAGSNSSWTAVTATKDENAKFYVNFGNIYPVGTRIEWMLRANRTKIKSTTSYYWAYHPPKFAQPDSSPNTTSDKFDFYTDTIQ